MCVCVCNVAMQSLRRIPKINLWLRLLRFTVDGQLRKDGETNALHLSWIGIYTVIGGIMMDWNWSMVHVTNHVVSKNATSVSLDTV